jgi:hypothetical protein
MRGLAVSLEVPKGELMTAVRVVQFSACRPVLVEPVVKGVDKGGEGVDGGGSDDAVWQAVPC